MSPLERRILAALGFTHVVTTPTGTIVGATINSADAVGLKNILDVTAQPLKHTVESL